ncbi:hypothetical protein Hanom_Chr03g00213721 [Helianthus anomalus]
MCRHQLFTAWRGWILVRGYRMKEERERVAHQIFNQSSYFLFFFFLNKKTSPPRKEWRHQIEGVGRVKGELTWRVLIGFV